MVKMVYPLQKPKRPANPWSVEEHDLFLEGLKAFGKGHWREISRHFVLSRTPTQVASHAQKYFARISRDDEKKRRRQSIFDSSEREAVKKPKPETRPAPVERAAFPLDDPEVAVAWWWWMYAQNLQMTRRFALRACVERPTPIRGRVPVPMKM